jgi:hypothetical protein
MDNVLSFATTDFYLQNCKDRIGKMNVHYNEDLGLE